MQADTTPTPGQNIRRRSTFTLLTGALGLALLPTLAGAQARSRAVQPATPAPQQQPVYVPSAPRVTPPSTGGLYGAYGPGRTTLPDISTDRGRIPYYVSPGSGRYSGSPNFNSLFPGSRTLPSDRNGVIVRTDPNSRNAADRLNARMNGLDGTTTRVHGGGNVATGTTRPNVVNPGANYERFRRSHEGDLYNGVIRGPSYTIYTRGHVHNYYDWGSAYFAGGWGYYPYYSPSYIAGVTCFSVYSPYYGVLPPYISQVYVNYSPPYSYVPYPLYNNLGVWQGYRTDDLDTYYLNQQREELDRERAELDRERAELDRERNQQVNDGNADTDSQLPDRPAKKSDTPRKDTDEYRIGEGNAKNESALDATVADIRAAWQKGDIQTLSKHIRRDSRIAVYLRGKYQYSLEAGDYVDMTMDAFRNTKTVRFELNKIQRKENGVYLIEGSHVYRDPENQARTVHISFVVEKMDGEYIITQVGTAPDRIEQE